MILETLRIHTVWLGNATYGVDAQLALLDSAGLLDSDDVPPDVKFIGNAIDDEVVAQWKEPVNRPAIYLSLDLPADFAQSDQRPGQIRGVVPVGIRYLTAHADYRKAKKDTAHTMRAIRRSLSVLYQNAQEASRTRNGVYVEGYERIMFGELEETVGNCQVLGGMVVRAQAVDTKP